MGFLSAMKGANNAWGTIICAEGVGTIGPENFIKNTDHNLMITIGTHTFTFSKRDVQSIKIIASTSEWIKYLILLKNGKSYVAIFMMTAPEQNKKNSPTASATGKKINMAVQNFEWWMFDLIYPNDKEQKNNVKTKKQNEDVSVRKDEVVENTDDSAQQVQNINDNWYSDDDLDDDSINQPREDECPCCFSKIKPDDIECHYCGNKLK